MPFVKGKSGNKNGRPKGTTRKQNKLEAAIERATTAKRLDDVLNFLYSVVMGDKEELGQAVTIPERLRASDIYLVRAKEYYKGELKTVEKDGEEGKDDDDDVAPVFSIV